MYKFISSGPVLWTNRFKSPAFWLATGFGSGLLRPAPGTWGSLVAALIAWICLQANSAHPALLISGLALVSFAVGIWASDVWETKTGQHDSGMIVIDEFSGMWFCLIPLAAEWHNVDNHGLWLIGGFLLFRFFDIAKPYPISWIDDKMPGAMGVMLDDVAAGFISGLILFGLMCLVYM